MGVVDLAAKRKLSKKVMSRQSTVESLGELAANGSSRGSTSGSGSLISYLLHHWYVSWMFVFIPLGIASNVLRMADWIIFATNFLAIVPLAWIMGKATEDCAAHLGSIAGGLMNAWFGNIVEMLLCVAGLRQGELVVVRCTLIGSILSNLLLVSGCSLLAGGIKWKVQEFSAMGASTTASLLLLGTFCAGLPSMYASISPSGAAETLGMSRVISVLLIGMYAQFMVFQLRTHSFLFSDDDDDGEDDTDMSVAESAFTLVVCTVLAAVCSEYLIASIQGTISTWRVSKEFVGIVLLPIIGNAAEHYTSVVVALHNSMDLSLGCAVGSSCQMLLFVTPVTVLSGLLFGQPMSLDLHVFEIIILIVSVLIITGILQDGYSNWLEGSVLLTAYATIAIVYWYENPKLSDVI